MSEPPVSELRGPRRRPGGPRGDPEGAARELCLELLASRARSRAELAGALLRRGIPAEAAERALSRLAEVGLIDDRAFAEAYVASRRASAGLARRALSERLQRRGVAPATAAEALAGLDEAAEESAARSLARQRLAAGRELAPATQMLRLAGMLARKGYPRQLAFQVAREELAAQGVELPEEVLAELAEENAPDLWP